MKDRSTGLLAALDHYLVILCRTGLFASFMVLIVSVLVQVIGRTFVHSSPVWTEELTRFALLYMTGFGAGLAFRSGDLVNVDLVSESLPAKASWFMRLIATTAVAALCILLLAPAWRYTMIGVLQTSPALGLRMHYVHVTISLLLFVLLLFAMLRILRMLFAGDSGRADRDELMSLAQSGIMQQKSPLPGRQDLQEQKHS